MNLSYICFSHTHEVWSSRGKKALYSFKSIYLTNEINIFVTELQLQKKWKSLRDCFQKYLVNPFKFKRPYIYSKQLQFLLKDKKLPVQRKKTPIQVGSSESDDEDSRPKNVWVSKKRIKLQKAEEESDDDNDVTDDYTFEANATTELIDTRNTSDVHGQFAFANVDAQIRGDSEDSDRMFLMSLLPHLRSIPEEFRLNVKLELMQVLRVANESTAKLKYPSSSLD